ncbi:hypothetical protein K2X14_08635 [Acetobacter sp. TBRC 12305]|uniref:Uncharacterized protein n=1 Tax=Acetobacter garciniae TaxID=2817435 RepID=A0A939KMB5_9PROT|nr:hypothetical protein [Acetobacter garciniae]MBO1325133.1 hypothetical protein [Acetobacter garciniae]MBX0344896.1 hypothetical protein [Acetobacter garciniae]
MSEDVAAPPQPAFPVLSAPALRQIVHDMNHRGYGVAQDCIRPEDLAPLAAFIEHAVAQAGGEYISFTGAEALRDTFLHVLSGTPEFMAACRALYEAGTRHPLPHAAFYQVLRCLSGKTGADHAFLFHYDSFVLTALMPVIMPTQGQLGDLIMLPRMRKIRRTYLGNLLDKVLLDNRVTQKFLKKHVLSGRIKTIKVSMKPGNIYFFWGYRVVHANEPCDHDKIRATALFHYGNPHAHSLLRRIMRKTSPA